ncbi:hypothetical protein FJTKL_15113 [Diaporthe vaccinii]|uniref:Amidase domain-containing protein n=2 Tax=Diaporthe vaccinii TaxID=105482 RepID=A0ABR4E5V6_9PEZI
MAIPKLDVLSVTAADLRDLLQAKQVNSVQLVKTYLSQIAEHDAALNAFICLPPEQNVVATAALLDKERLEGRVRGPLHGIPVVLKDCFVSAEDLGMSTTAGSWALVGAKSSKNSAMVQKLVDAGLIILGKTNMTEFAGMKMTMMMPGWSGYGGQTISPYAGKIEDGETILGHSAPGGSSTGSAVAVAAGFSPVAIGAETIGSIITPASRAALYALKPTVGVQDVAGSYSLTDFFDSPGPMAKCAADVQALLEVMLRREFLRSGFGEWKDVSIGFADPQVWKMAGAMCRQHEGTAEEMESKYISCVDNLKSTACQLHYPISIPDISVLTVDEEDAIMPIAFWEFKNICIPRFLEAFDECPVRNLEDIVRFNQQNKDKAMPEPYTEQGDIIKAFENVDTEENVARLKDGLRKKARSVLEPVFQDNGINIIAAPADSSLCIHAAAAGYPIATVPLGQLTYNQRPFGLCLMARDGYEEALLQFMRLYESVAPPRPIPQRLGRA